VKEVFTEPKEPFRKDQNPIIPKSWKSGTDKFYHRGKGGIHRVKRD